MKNCFFFFLCGLLFCGCISSFSQSKKTLDWVEISADKTQFVKRGTDERLLFWGVNYDRDTRMRLLDDYWDDEWDKVVRDFQEIKKLNANVVRIHLQVGRMMVSATQMNENAVSRLKQIIQLAEDTGLYLYITGLACYKKPVIPVWYDSLNEEGRWAVQATFWKHVARICASSSAVFCYDLMNEPLAPSEPTDGWLTPEGLEDFFYVQYITRTPNGRTAHAIAKAWIDCLVAAIRSEDTRHLVTVGVIPWAMVWPDAKPLFYDPIVCENLDFVSVHFYPERQQIEKALTALSVYAIGKPLVIAEMFPMSCSIEEMDQFIEGSRSVAQGWISFYWGKTIDEYAHEAASDIGEQLTKEWLQYFKSKRIYLQ
jgi:hypothetical protein